MLIDNTVVYSQKYKIEIGKPGKNLYYSFDYDERSYSINMEFQHFHQFYEMCIFLDEKAGHLIDGVWYDMRCCDIVALRPTLLHKTEYPEGAPNKRLIIQFSIPPMISAFEGCMKHIYSVFDGSCPIYRFDGPYKKAVMEKLNDIYYLSQNPNELTELAIHNKFLEFLSLIYLYRDKNIYFNRLDFDNITSKVYSITAYIHSHFTEELTLDSIARKFYVSSYYLSHQFKRVTGFTLTDYIQMTRISNAQTLLLSTDNPITDIAFQSGFSSFSQFNRAFHKFLRQSPSAFRRDAKVQQSHSLLLTKFID